MPKWYCDRLDKKKPDPERGILVRLTEVRTSDPFPMIPHQVETQFIASQSIPVAVSGQIPLPSAAPVNATVTANGEHQVDQKLTSELCQILISWSV